MFLGLNLFSPDLNGNIIKQNSHLILILTIQLKCAEGLIQLFQAKEIFKLLLLERILDVCVLFFFSCSTVVDIKHYDQLSILSCCRPHELVQVHFALSQACSGLVCVDCEDDDAGWDSLEIIGPELTMV